MIKCFVFSVSRLQDAAAVREKWVYVVRVLMWQYTDSFKMEGVSKPIDMNLMLVKK